MESEVNQLLAKLNLNPIEIWNVYLLGSRLWGTATSESDYDLLIVTKTPPSNTTLHASNVDANLLDWLEFQKRINEHELQETWCLYLPDSHKLLETKRPKMPKFNQNRWLDKVIYRLNRNLTYANKLTEKHNYERASKTYFHTLKNLLLSLQLLESKPIDFQIAKSYYDRFWTLEEFEIIYQPLYQRLKNFS